jgi:hypothetical protein
MAAKGFTYTPTAAVRLDSTGTSVPLGADSADSNTRYVQSLAPERREAYYLALYGIADPNAEDAQTQSAANPENGGGCSGEALRALPGVYAARSSLASEYVALRRAVQRNARVLAQERQWSTCMARLGIRYNSPDALAADVERIKTRENPATPSPNTELLTRTSEAAEGCSQAARLDETIAEVTRERESEFVARHRALLEEHRRRVASTPNP